MGVQDVIKYALQPLVLISVLIVWSMYPESLLTYPLTLLAVHLLLGSLEYRFPARRDWVSGYAEKLANVGMVLVLLAGTIGVAVLYAEYLIEPLASAREELGFDVWPHHWPLLVQVVMVFLISELIWYWVHRAEHRWYAVWRVSGHGAHHSFNFGLNHPLELLFLAIPPAIVEIVFGVGLAAAGVTILLSVQATMAHTNLTMNSRWIDLVLTTNRHHLSHHSVVLEESNTNYGCAVILWDRVFGTFVDHSVNECGTGPSEPTLGQKLLMPLREPEDTSIAPG